jgi:hypothetical protein
MILSGELDEPVLSSRYLPTARPNNPKTVLPILGQRYTFVQHLNLRGRDE